MAAERTADIYDSEGPRAEKVRRLFQRFTSKQLVLDVGCANGMNLGPLTKTHEIHGVDISEAMVAMAIQAGLIARPLDLETNPLPYADKMFDVVFCGEVIEHHVDTDWMLSEINRVLKPGGLFILTFPNIRTVLSLAMMLFCDLPPMYAARYRAVHFRDFTLRTIKIALQNHAFVVEQAIGSAFFFPKIGEFGSALASFFPSWSHTVIVISHKENDSVYISDESVRLDLWRSHKNEA